MDLNLSFNDYKVYLNGIEVPADNITISNTIAQGPSTAIFTLHPTESSFDIPIRTIVDITFRSDIYQNIDKQVSSEDVNGFLGKMPEVTLFEGEILSKNFIKSSSQNQIQVTASDFRQIFDVPLLYLIDMATTNMTSTTRVKIEHPSVEFGVDSGLLDPFGWLKMKMDQSNGSLTGFMISLINNLKNDYYKGYTSQRKITSRIKGYFGTVVGEYLYQQNVQDLMFSQLNSAGGSNSGMYAINTLISMLFSAITGTNIVDVYTNITPPPPKDGKLKNYLMTPRLIGVVPPICNVFFPELIGNLSVMDSIKFTRGVIEYDPFKENEGYSKYQDWSPRELVVAMESYSKEHGDAKLEHIVQYVMTAEEMRVGIFPAVMQVIGYPGNRTRSEICNYGFGYQRYSQNYAVMSDCPFNPFPVVGLPAVIHIPNSNFSGLGILVSVKHNLSNSSQTSSFEVINFTPKNELYLLEQVTKGFLSDFSSDKMIDVYNTLLDQKDAYFYGDTLLETFEELNKFYQDIASSSNSFKHAMNTVNRSIATVDDIKKFRGTSLYNSDATKKVIAYVEECREFTGKK